MGSRTYGWQITQPSKDQMEATPGDQTAANQWWQVQLIGKAGAQPQVRLGENRQWLPLLPEAGGYSLVFHRRLPLTRIAVTHYGDAHLQVRPISAAKALYTMAQAISRADAAKKQPRDRIVRKSWARWRKKGYQGALYRLVREYHPLLAQFHGADDPYPFWIEHFERPMQAAAESLPTMGPRFAIWLDAETPEQRTALKEAIEPSLVRQGYKDWFWADLEQKATDYNLLITQPGELAANALAIIAATLESRSEIELLYFDEDCLSSEGKRHTPDFKPEYNPDLLEALPYFGGGYVVGCGIANTPLTPGPSPQGEGSNIALSLGRGLGEGWLGEWAGAKEKDPRPLPHQNMLTAATTCQSKSIHHLPQVLFHRTETPPAEKATQPPLTEWPSQYSIRPGLTADTWHCLHPIPDPAPLVSLLIPTRDALPILRTAVESILERTQYSHYEILILDNQSQEPETLNWFQYIEQTEPRVRVLRYDHPFNYSAINNFGAEQAKGEVIGLINNDVEVISPFWLHEMVSHACRPEIGCVGAKLYYPDDTLQHGGVILGLWGLAGHSQKHFARDDTGYHNRLICTQNYSAVTAACLLVEKHIYEEVGGLEETLTVAFNDVDFCLKVREAGYRNLWTPWAELYHHESKTRGKEDTPEKKAREQQEIAYMQAKWQEILENDPAYNPNLTRVGEGFWERME